ncbi:MAG: type I methionyl aminopeptidase [Bacteriovoracaceae bacterium]|nr:type I methionyl aminopeptidase [Bacteriovoracaceae bacterium]
MAKSEIIIKNETDIAGMRAAGKLAAQCLNHVANSLRMGISTEELNTIAHQFITAHGAYPAPLNYHGFPKSICTSRNDVICHGIPSLIEVIQDGDIINLDITVRLNGYHGDTSKTYLIGNVNPGTRKLVQVTEECLMESIKQVRDGSRLGDVGAVIQEIAQSNGFTVVRDFCGHGIGLEFHEPPQVLHYGKRGMGVELKAGMIFTIEPMINMGSHRSRVLSDGWTAVTIDGKPSAQFEHTLLVTQHGCEILTIE